MNNLPMATRMGALDMQVCVPEGFSDEEVVEFAESTYPCGTSAGWQIRREGSKYLAGQPERVVCQGRKGFIHIMLDA